MVEVFAVGCRWAGRRVGREGGRKEGRNRRVSYVCFGSLRRHGVVWCGMGLDSLEDNRMFVLCI